MVARGEWDPKEDRLLVRALLTGGAAEEHEVDWGAAVPGRSEAQVRAARCCWGTRVGRMFRDAGR
jgi:hypothetical protein